MLAATLAYAGVAFSADSQPAVSIARAAELLEQGRYPEAESTATSARSLLEAETPVDSLALARALDLSALSLARGGRFEDPRAREAAHRSLEIRQRSLGAGHVEIATSLLVLGEIQRWAVSDSGGLSVLRRAVKLREMQLGPEHLATAEAWCQLGWACIDHRDRATGVPAFRRAVAIQSSKLGSHHRDLVQTLAGWAHLESETGHYAEAESLFLLALPGMERSLGPDHPVLAMTLMNYASVINFKGRREEVLPLVGRALAIRERVLGPGNFFTGWAYLCMGETFSSLGQPAAARPYFERGLDVLEQAAGKDSPHLVWPLGSLSNCLWVLGDVAESTPLLERSVEISGRASAGGNHHAIQGLIHLAQRRVALGDIAEGRRLAERALALSRAVGSSIMASANAMDAVAQYVWAHDPARARELWKRAARIYLDTAPQSLGRVHLYSRLAWEALWGGRHKESLEWRDQARFLADQLGRQMRDTDFGWFYLGSGQGLRAIGRPQEARRELQKSLAHFEAVYGPDHIGITPALDELSATCADLGEARESMRLAGQAAKIREGQVFDEISKLPENEAILFSGASPRACHQMLSLAAGPLGRDEAALREAWDTLARSRALVLGQVNRRHLVRPSEPDSELASLRAAAKAARERLAHLKVRGLAVAGYEVIRTATQESDRLERALGLRMAALRLNRARPRSSLDSVLRSLPARTALVGFARYQIDWLDHRRRVWAASRIDTRPAGDGGYYLAFVQSAPGEAPRVVPLGRADSIDAFVNAWRLQSGVAGGGRSEAAYRRAGAALRRAVWDPVAALLGSAERVFLVPDGALHFVNWPTLPVGASAYLVETGPTVHMLYSEHDLDRGPAPARGRGLLALGAPDFDADWRQVAAAASVSDVYRGARAKCPSFHTIRFAPLPHTGRELENIASAWRRSPGTAAEPVTTFLRAEATETQFKMSAPGHRVLHLATHGFWIGPNCGTRRPAGRGIGGMIETALLDHGNVASGNEDVLLSGLALAGANHRNAAPPDLDDGVLTADEIAALDLSGVEWAVLSACETGAGALAPGEGVLGVRRALRAAGARTVIVSLWPVDDPSAAEWMTRLYEARLIGEKDTAEAVRQASREMLQARRRDGRATHPGTWGAFIAVGDWN